MVKPMIFILGIGCLCLFVKLAMDHNESVGQDIKRIWRKLIKQEV